jgi:uncharacterized protein (TIGR03435 family)
MKTSECESGRGVQNFNKFLKILVTGLFALPIFGASPTFDVASVKVSKAPDALVLLTPGTMSAASGKMTVPNSGGLVSIRNWGLNVCIMAAWDLGPGQISGPSWMGSERYDIEARTSPDSSQADLRLMLQALLADRFKMAAHHETKESTGYALVVAKGGPKLKASTGDQRSAVVFAPPSLLIGNGSTMAGLALALSFPVGGRVADETGIAGEFDFSLTYARDQAAGVDAGPSIFTALQEQLGLRLEARKSTMDVLVVDRAERVPTEN